MKDFTRIDVNIGESVFIPFFLYIGKVRLLKNGGKRLYLYRKRIILTSPQLYSGYSGR